MGAGQLRKPVDEDLPSVQSRLAVSVQGTETRPPGSLGGI